MKHSLVILLMLGSCLSAHADEKGSNASLTKNADGSASLIIAGTAAAGVQELVQSYGIPVQKTVTVICAPPESPAGTECEVRISK